MLHHQYNPALAICIVLTSTLAHAQAIDPAARASAVELFDAGQKLLAEGHVSEACPKFGESYRLDPQLGALLHLGDCLEQEGRLASAYAAFREAAELAHNKADDRQTLAEERGRALEPRLTRLRIDVTERVEGLEVLRDGLVLSVGSLGVSMPVDPGQHEIEARAPGYESWHGHSVVAGEGRSETFVIPALNQKTASAPAATPPPPPTNATTPAPLSTTRGTPLRTLGFVAGGAGVLGLGAGVYFLVQKGNKLAERDDVCPSGVDCAPGSQARIDSLTEDARGQATLSTISFVAGGVLTAAGVALIVATPEAKAEQQARLQLAPFVSREAWGIAAAQRF